MSLPARTSDANASQSKLVNLTSTMTEAIKAVSALIRLSVLIVILTAAWMNRDVIAPFLDNFFSSATHVEVGARGFTLDRQVSATRTIDEIVQRREKQGDGSVSGLNADYARGAIVRASRNAPAITGARILWVDGHPENNRLEESIFRDMGIDVRRALGTSEALRLLPGFSPDLIISNVIRPSDPQTPLSECPVHYFGVPNGVNSSLQQINSAANAGTGPTTGFAMAELIAKTSPEYVDPVRPRIIYYSASGGEILAAQCSRFVTNRVDVLLQGVVSALEELRWQKLDRYVTK
jgi:CheY-like chemotaxis protein